MCPPFRPGPHTAPRSRTQMRWPAHRRIAGGARLLTSPAFEAQGMVRPVPQQSKRNTEFAGRTEAPILEPALNVAIPVEALLLGQPLHIWLRYRHRANCSSSDCSGLHRKGHVRQGGVSREVVINASSI